MFISFIIYRPHKDMSTKDNKEPAWLFGKDTQNY